MRREALGKVVACTALLTVLAVTGITQAQDPPPPAAFGSPYLNGLVVDNPESVTDPLAQRMFNGRGGWLVVPVYEWVNFSDGHYDLGELQYQLRSRVEVAARAGYSVILRLYWKQDGAAGPAGAPPGQWCIPPEDQQGFKQQYAEWCKLVAEKLGGGDQSLPAMSTHFVIGNEPNQKCEHGGSGCFRASWYADVFRACQTKILEAAPNSKVIVAGVTPGPTGCQQDDEWLDYVGEIASNLGEEADHYAIHGQVEACVTVGPDGPSPSLDQAYESGRFFDYYAAITNGRETGQNLYCYIVEINPFFGDPAPEEHYVESWLIHTFDAVANWNDQLVDIYGHRPFQCVCYFSYDLPGATWQTHYNLRASATEANTNHSLHVAAEKDFPLLIHRNDQPRPRVNIIQGGLVSVIPQGIGGTRARDNDPTTAWNGGNPWNSIWLHTFDSQIHQFDRVLAWVYQGVDNATTEVTANADPSNPNATVDCRCEFSANSKDLYIWTPDDLDRSALNCLRLTINNDTFANGDCHDNITETDMGWYEVCVYPPAEAVAGGGVGPARQIHMIAPPTVSQLTSTSAVVSWQTDVPSTTRVDLDPGSSAIYDGALTTSHSVTLTGLYPNSVYRYAATSAKPGYGPAYAEGGFVTQFPITITNILVDNITQTSARIRWTTDVASTSRVDYGTTAQYGQYVYDTSQVTSHAMTLTGLSAGTTYHYKVTSTRSGCHGASGDLTFTTSLPPIIITDISVDSIAETSARISWTTNVASTSRVDYGTTTSYGQNVYAALQVTSHAITLTGLSAGTTYHYKVTSTRGGYQDGVSSDATFTTTTPPLAITISSIYVDNITQTSARVRWTTNVASTSRVYYRALGTTPWSTVYNSSLVSSHAMTLSGLSAGTPYQYYVKSTRSGYQDATSSTLTFTTAAGGSTGTLTGTVTYNDLYQGWMQPGTGENLTQDRIDKPVKRIGAGATAEGHDRQAMAEPIPIPGTGPLPGATITVAGLSAESGLNGSYAITGIPAGTYTATCYHPARGTLSATVTITANGTTYKNWEYNGYVW